MKRGNVHAKLTSRNSRDTTLSILLLALLHEEGLKKFECLANLLLADFRQVHDLAERAGNVIAATGEEDGTSDHHLSRLALEKTTLFCILEEVLGRVGDGVGKLPSITQGANLLVCLKQVLVALVV